MFFFLSFFYFYFFRLLFLEGFILLHLDYFAILILKRSKWSIFLMNIQPVNNKIEDLFIFLYGIRSLVESFNEEQGITGICSRGKELQLNI